MMQHFFSLVLLLLLWACSFEEKEDLSFPFGDLSIIAEPTANFSSPVKIDFIIVKDKEILKTLMTLSAREYFTQKEQLKRDYDEFLDIYEWELTPGQRLTLNSRPLEGREAVGFLIFADYFSPGTHRQKLRPEMDARVELHEREFDVVYLGPMSPVTHT